MESVVIRMPEFFSGKKVLVTGHTGFKGTWLCKILVSYGAIVAGYSLEPPTFPSLFEICNIKKDIISIIGDIRDIDKLNKVFSDFQPDIVIHLAAQPLVRESYNDPRYTYETNVMGTVNVLDCIRRYFCVKSVLIVTTDKVYQNNEWCWGYRESDPLDGSDPYSNSKSCSELVTHSYIKSFFNKRDISVSTARAGNVIGGGDYAKDRIIPDCVKSAEYGNEIVVRNPFSIRPYQHVLEPLFAYLLIIQKQSADPNYSGYYNVGPDDKDCITTGKLVDLFCEKWEKQSGNPQHWINQNDGGPHEANFLKLDCSKIKKSIQWKPRWDIGYAVEKTIEWSLAYQNGQDVSDLMNRQIEEYFQTYPTI